MRRATLLFICCFLLFIGCQERDMGMNSSSQESTSLDRTIDDRTIAGEALPEEAGNAAVDENIIRTAYLSVRASNVSKTYDNTLNLVKKYDAVILNSSISRYTDTDEAQVLVKVKPQYFMILLDELASIGQIESKSVTEEDVTEEYFDIQSRLTNARKVQDRLYIILYRASKVEDILRVEKEIERIGEKIEVLEGKIKYFDSMVDYSRISITIYSEKRPFINLGSIARGFGNAVKYAVHVFCLMIWFVIIIIPIVAMIFVLRPIITVIARRFKKKQ